LEVAKRRWARFVPVAGCLALGACLMEAPDPPGPAAGLFRADAGGPAEGLAPGPRGFWYVRAPPRHFVKIGFATWRTEPPLRGLRRWLAVVGGRRAGPARAPQAVVSDSLQVPAPSVLQVVNVLTGASVDVEVERRAALGPGVVIDLPAGLAASVDGEAGRPLLVRLRYVAPVIAYAEPRTLEAALRGPRRAEPPGLAAAAPATSPNAQPVQTAAGVLPKPISEHPLALRPAIWDAAGVAAELADTRAVWVQVGAFASRANAGEAVRALASIGEAEIVPLRRGPLTLYRVVLTGARTTAAAEKLRVRAAAIGFDEALLTRAF
jgi:hypothetical protein